MDPVRLVLGVLAVLFVLLYLMPLASRYWNNRQYMVSRARAHPSSVDGEHYRVHLTHRNPTKAADKLARLHAKAVELMRHLRRQDLAPGSPFRVARGNRAHVAKLLLERYDRDKLAESSPRNPEGDTSFTLWKGRLLALCLREKDPAASGDPETYDVHDMETLWFVTVHELAHIGIDNVGHPPEFWSAFKHLLLESEEAGLAPPGGWPDYELFPVPYCGLTVDYNPLFDATTPLPPA